MTKKTSAPHKTPVHHEKQDLMSKTTQLVSAAGDVASKGLYFGLGASLLLAENTQQFFNKAINRGQKVDLTDNIYRIASMTKKQADAIRSYLQRKPKTEISALESKVKQEVSNMANMVQIPLRKNIQELNRKVTELSKQVNKVMAHAK